MGNKFHEANRKHWDAASERWAQGAEARGLWRRCPSQPELVLCDRELAYLREIAGKDVCDEFHWTVSDYIYAVLNAGGRLFEVHEFGENVDDWEGAPLHGLPEFLLIVARKVGGAGRPMTPDPWRNLGDAKYVYGARPGEPTTERMMLTK